jgi:hypothetical protein
MKLKFCCNDGWMSNHKLFERGTVKMPEQWQQCTEVQGEYVGNRYQFLKRKKKIVTDKFL